MSPEESIRLKCLKLLLTTSRYNNANDLLTDSYRLLHFIKTGSTAEEWIEGKNAPTEES